MCRSHFLPVILTFVLYTALAANSKAQDVFNITVYGAVGDAKTNNAKAIQSAIDAAHQKGKGKVIIPPGYFLTGPVTLKSEVELHLAQGAVLLGSTQRMDYGREDAAPLIGAEKATDVSITGSGTINGQGRDLVKDLFKQLHAGKVQDEQWKTKRPMEKNRPGILVFKSCKNITVKGITIKNGSGWVQDYVNCDGVIIDSIRVESTEYWNNDGIDIVNSKNVRITNCYIDVTDDAICLKSEGSPGWCENVYVNNCTLRSSASGFKLGTGSHGGFKKITVSNLQIYDTYRSAIALEAVDGGFLEGIDIQHVTAKNTGNAIFMRLGHRNAGEQYSTVKDIHISDVEVEVPAGKPDIGYPVEGPPLKFPHNVFPSSITGLPGHPVQNVTLENIRITYEGGAQKELAYFAADSLKALPENSAGYPEFSMFGEMPAWGLYVRHVEGLQMKNVRLTTKAEDFRTALIFDDVKGLKMDGIVVPNATLPSVILNKVVKAEMGSMTLPAAKENAILIKY